MLCAFLCVLHHPTQVETVPIPFLGIGMFPVLPHIAQLLQTIATAARRGGSTALQLRVRRLIVIEEGRSYFFVISLSFSPTTC